MIHGVPAGSSQQAVDMNTSVESRKDLAKKVEAVVLHKYSEESEGFSDVLKTLQERKFNIVTYKKLQWKNILTVGFHEFFTKKSIKQQKDTLFLSYYWSNPYEELIRSLRQLKLSDKLDPPYLLAEEPAELSAPAAPAESPASEAPGETLVGPVIKQRAGSAQDTPLLRPSFYNILSSEEEAMHVAYLAAPYEEKVEFLSLLLPPEEFNRIEQEAKQYIKDLVKKKYKDLRVTEQEPVKRALSCFYAVSLLLDYPPSKEREDAMVYFFKEMKKVAPCVREHVRIVHEAKGELLRTQDVGRTDDLGDKEKEGLIAEQRRIMQATKQRLELLYAKTKQPEKALGVQKQDQKEKWVSIQSLMDNPYRYSFLSSLEPVFEQKNISVADSFQIILLALYPDDKR